jgi:transcriptional regulator with XRE-family HTH domain
MGVQQRLAANVRRLRKETGLSQEDFANKHSIDRTYVSGIERGVRNPTILVVERFARALKADVIDLLSEPKEHQEPTQGQPRRRRLGKK